MLRIPLITYVFMEVHKVLDQIFTGRPSIIWFKNHVFTNFLVTCYTLQDCVRLLYCRQNCMKLNPQGGFLLSKYTDQVPAEEFIVSTVAALHFHHLLNYRNLRRIDYLHHYIMLIVLVISYMFDSKCYMSMFMFFLCGFPGMIDFSMLALDVDREIEKKINVYLNNYIRGPGIVFTLGLYWRESFGYNMLVFWFGFIALFWNATYFAHDATRSYYQSIRN